MQKRILLLTDSLGCPRDDMTVDHTWVDKMLRSQNHQNFYFYTYCMHGLYFNNIPIQYIQEIQPDIIIIQIGVVDACRRTLTKRQEKIFCRIPFVKKYMHYIRKKYHYLITKHFNIHFSSVDDVKRVCTTLLETTKADLCFVMIAPASLQMKKNTYHFAEDVKSYNDIFTLMRDKNTDRVCCIDPYKNADPESIFLEDGHHLNTNGIELVYSEVSQYLKKGEFDYEF